MTVGSGSTSASAAALIASLDDDSGYGSMLDGEYQNDGSARGWNPGLTQDLPTPMPTSTTLGQDNPAAENERRVIASHIHQLYYNRNRVTLGRAIGRTVEVLKDLQHMNSTWPAHYPSVQHQHDAGLSQSDSRPGVLHTQSTLDLERSGGSAMATRPGPRRAATSLADDTPAESSGAVTKRIDETPETLITPKAAHDFSILKLDLKLQGMTQSEIAHSMNRRTVASLLDGRINQSLRHLLLLRDRIEDTSSKVLVTGDLNAGKSTFCNALLRRKILPEDQQPCTSIFCEVLDARENEGHQEVHAIHKDAVYNRNDERTWDRYELWELENIVVDNTTYSQCKVYIRDSRAIDESLLNNGVVDISLIDAPGLNFDSVKTTSLFARQQEIDVVVFVVSATDHFTQSARDFIEIAAHEKAYMFIVVNGYNSIKNKERCQREVLKQVAKLSPRTFKESAELVHFVSSNTIPVAPAPSPDGPPGGNGGSGGTSSGALGDPDNDDGGLDPSSGKGKGKDKENLEDFKELESSLRRFVLEKRARSKLAPAKTYLLNVLSDLNTLASVNRDVAQSEFDRVTEELAEIEPAYENSKRARSEVSDEIEKTIESTCTGIYRHTREALNSAIGRVADQELGVEYPGLFNAFEYAEDIKTAILDQISAAVTLCEEDAREKAVGGVGAIKLLGMRHLGDEYEELNFRSDLMFRRRKDALARQVDTPVEIWDFFDLGGAWEKQEKVAGTGMAMTVVGVLGGRMVGGFGWMDGALGVAKVMGTRNLKHLIIPGIVTAGTLRLS